jgi:type II secretory pathway pseudopilin PulG
MMIVSILLGTGAASVLLVVLSLLFVRIGLPVYQSMRADSMNRASQVNLQKIARALNQYQAEHGTYPPAYLVDEHGTPTHSWRVLILPQLGYDHLYHQIDFDSPWDSQVNSLLKYSMPVEYQSFGERNLGSSETRFVVVTGPQTMFPAEKSVSAQTVTDHPRTILTVIEINGPPIEWMRPDMEPSHTSLSLLIHNEPADADNLGATLTGNVAFLSGETYFLPEHTSWQLLTEMLTHSGGEYTLPALDALLNDS